MERLTTRNSEGIAVLKQPYECERCRDLQWALPDLGNGSPTDRLAEYEDLEDKLNKQFNGCIGMEAFVDSIIEYDKQFKKDEELAEAVMITNDEVRKFREWKSLEEQGKLLKLPCKVGDTVWYISDRTEKQGRKKVSVPFIDKGIVDNITFGDLMIPQITVCNDENIWTTFDAVEDFGTIAFLTQQEAEAALKNGKGGEEQR